MNVLNIVSRIISFLYFCYFIITAALLFTILVFLLPFVVLFDNNKTVLHYITLLWGYHFVRLNPFWRCKIEGRQFLQGSGNCVIVANHQSIADIFVLSGLQHHFRWVAKESLMQIPFFGWIMRLNGDVALKRGDRSSIKAMILQCRQLLERGVSILMFPEGTRCENGQLGTFFAGPFRLAVDCCVPIVPVIISGTAEVLPKHAKLLRLYGDINVKILPPVLPHEFANNSTQLRAHVHELMQRTLREGY